MPTYCYKNKDGKTLERYYKFGEARNEITINAEIYTRDIKAELASLSVSVRSSKRSKSWPLTCYASGVNASQAGELREYLGSRGCPTEITADGDPVYTSAAHRKKALKLRGMHDRNSFC